MLEFNVLSGGQSRTFVLSVSTLASVEPSGSDHTLLTLMDGRQLMAAVPYARFEQALLTVLSQFVSLLEPVA